MRHRATTLATLWLTFFASLVILSPGAYAQTSTSPPNLRVGDARIISSLMLSKPLGATFTQTYAIELLYEVQSCGKISLSLFWSHQPGQPYAIPIPTPDFEFENTKGLMQSVNTAAASPGY